MSAKKTSHKPFQNYSKIKGNDMTRNNGRFSEISGSIESDGLFTDSTFSPDQSSLTYVYSGDDRFENIVFKRPKEISGRTVLAGVGGISEQTFPWRHWKDRHWFQAAFAIVSLNIRFMENMIPGYKHFEQSFNQDYIGCFQFNIWRFGEWVETVVDDFLPVLNDKLVFCPATGTNPTEFCGPLLEKAYAKLNMTYQAIESGNILDALTDLTGATCEFYTPDVNPPENLFLILHRSCVNRSMMVCWRNDKRLTPTGFYSYQKDVECVQDESQQELEQVTQEEGRALHIVTATAKFPTKDGRILEMVRLKSPFPSEPKWFGKFSNGDSNSWDSLKSYFPMEFKPLANKEKDEYWLTLEDFHCNFGGLIIISSTQPFHKEGINIERHHEDDMDLMIKTPPISEVNNSTPFSAANNKRRLCNLKDDKQDFGKGNIEIAVLEGEKTVKTDTVNTSARKNSGENTKAISFKNFSDKDEIDSILDNRMRVTTLQHIINKRRYTDGSIFSVCSQTQSMFSTSDISVHLSSDSKQEVQKTRPVSASGRLRSRFESQAGCLSSLRQCNFLATKIDHFRTLGSWRSVLEYKGQWTSTDTVSCTTFSGNNIDVMDKYPRIALTILGTDCDDNTLTSSNLQITSHVLISLIQGYTHTSRATSSLYGRIGFTIFKTKNLEKYEKRPLSKLQVIGNVASKKEERQVTARFDLSPGGYFIVPYPVVQSHEGSFLLRVLGGKYDSANKSGCVIS